MCTAQSIRYLGSHASCDIYNVEWILDVCCCYASANNYTSIYNYTNAIHNTYHSCRGFSVVTESDH